MKSTLREVLAGSHVAAVAIAILLVWSLNSAFEALGGSVLRALGFVITAIAILGTPYPSPGFSPLQRMALANSSELLLLTYAAIDLAAAWLLARWIYRMGPVRSLNAYWTRLKGRSHA